MENMPTGLQPQDEFQPTNRLKKKRNVWIAVGIIAGIVLIAGAAFVAGKLLKPAVATGGGPGGLVIGGPGGQQVKVNEQKAAQLPQGSPTVTGVFQSRQDQVITIGTGQIKLTVQQDPSGSASRSASSSGPSVEVVTTHDTKVYKDVTPIDIQSASQNGGKVQQVVEPGSLDDIGNGNVLTVWGSRQGNRVVADVLVYR